MRKGGRKFNNGRDSNFIFQFGNLHFLLLTQIRIAHIFHPVSKPGISQNLLEYFVPQNRHSVSLGGLADAAAKTTIIVFITVSIISLLAVVRGKLLLLDCSFFHSPTVHQHSCFNSAAPNQNQAPQYE